MRYVIKATVEDVYHYQPVVRVDHAVGDAAPVVHRADRGWYVRLSNSYEAVYVGDERPVLNAGDKVKVIIELDHEQGRVSQAS